MTNVFVSFAVMALMLARDSRLVRFIENRDLRRTGLDVMNWIELATSRREPEAGSGARGSESLPKIEGDDDFRRQVLAALELLRQRDPKGFDVVITYVGLIKQEQRSAMRTSADPPRIELNLADQSVTYCAAGLVHEAWHSKQYQENREPGGRGQRPAVWEFTAAERECEYWQLRALWLMGAPQAEIRWIESQDGTHWDANGDGKRDWDDYFLNDW